MDDATVPTDTTLPLDTAATADQALVAEVLARRPGAFEGLMRAHNRRLFRTARSILRDDTEAEEAVQEGYISAYAALADFKGQSSLSTWLTRIVVNAALMRRRKRGQEAPLPTEVPDPQVPPAETPEAQVMRRQLRRLIERSVDGLPEQCRSIFMLRSVEELSVAETAACLGVSEAAVKTGLFRARRLLRERIGAEIGATLDTFFAFDGARCDRLVAAVLGRLGLSPPG
ncbi:RNA polymerase sigma factor [Denitromonas sp.]|uniref:RNA polymerase sigma factor n=1 Tax=Denitromonas sp. TaxID=2734609 RepID=UPI002AFE0C4A|nr:RNA polymerase sigma factor [Denitromonas sp.]